MAPPGPPSAMLLGGMFVFAGLLMAAAFAYIGDGDLAWQRALGESVLRMRRLPETLGAATFSSPGAHWIAHEWIFSVIWAEASAAGAEPLFRAACALIAFAALAIDDFRARSASPAGRFAASGLILGGLLWSFGARAQIVAWPLLALVLLVLESSPRRRWWLVPIAVVWDNVHASGVIVPVIVAVDGLGRALDARALRPLVAALALAFVCLGASAATPFGFAYAAFAFAWSVNPATNLIAEWQPIAASNLEFFTTAFIVGGLLVASELRGVPLPWSQRLLAVAFFAAALLHVRDLALFVIVAGPWAAAATTALIPRVRTASAAMSWSDSTLVGLCALAAVVIAGLGGRAHSRDPNDPAPAVDRLLAARRPVRVACEDFSWCSRFAAQRRITVLLDGRIDAYPPAVIADYRLLLRGDVSGPIDRWSIEAVIAQRDGALARSLRASRWRSVAGSGAVLFLPPSRARRAPYEVGRS